MVTSLRNVSAGQCHLQGGNTKLKAIYSKIDYIYETHKLRSFYVDKIGELPIVL